MKRISKMNYMYIKTYNAHFNTCISLKYIFSEWSVCACMSSKTSSTVVWDAIHTATAHTAEPTGVCRPPIVGNCLGEPAAVAAATSTTAAAVRRIAMRPAVTGSMWVEFMLKNMSIRFWRLSILRRDRSFSLREIIILNVCIFRIFH